MLPFEFGTADGTYDESVTKCSGKELDFAHSPNLYVFHRQPDGGKGLGILLVFADKESETCPGEHDDRRARQ